MCLCCVVCSCREEPTSLDPSRRTCRSSLQNRTMSRLGLGLVATSAVSNFSGLTFVATSKGSRATMEGMLPVHLQSARAVSSSTSSSTRPKALFCTTSVVLAACFLKVCKKEKRLQRKAWGDDVKFFDGQIKENVEAAEGLRLITLQVPTDVSEPYARAGQFVQAKPDPSAKASFYAISSPPGGVPLEFLIKVVDNNKWITGSQSGDFIQLSPAMGKGFNVDCEAWKSSDVNQVNLFATGSGIAPMRAVIESAALSGKVCRLYYGARTESGLAFKDRFDEWRKTGLEIMPVLSSAPENWSGRKGYVQAAFLDDEERGEGFVLSARHGALLCGQKEMVQDVRKVYNGLGVPEERTLLNF